MGEVIVLVGKVVKVNYKRGLVIFEDEIGDYGYFEILGTEELEEDDIVLGNLHSLGGETIVKQSTKERINVSVEDFGMSYKIATEMVFGK